APFRDRRQALRADPTKLGSDAIEQPLREHRRPVAEDDLVAIGFRLLDEDDPRVAAQLREMGLDAELKSTTVTADRQQPAPAPKRPTRRKRRDRRQGEAMLPLAGGAPEPAAEIAPAAAVAARESVLNPP